MNVNTDRTLAERAYSAIHAAIVNGEFGPGYRLRIDELSANLKISPTPIREALYRLQSVGLAERAPHRGARVMGLSPEDLRELYEVRLALEPVAAGKAADKFSSEIAETAREYLDRQMSAERRKDFSAAWKMHTAFHFTLYEASGSTWLVRLITPLWESSQRYRLRWEPLRQDLGVRDDEHSSILEACIEHDSSRAARELYNHLAQTANQIATQMVGSPLFDLKEAAKG